ncbi:hypothetical protein [uncultured Methanobrevibacter sp.]|nr:hypothetical protein [uncultured Methanobrevibacter sp.]
MFFGGRNHTTVIHACEKVEKMREEDKGFDKLMQQHEGKVCST